MASEMLQMIGDMMRTRQSVIPPDIAPVTMRENMERMTGLMALPPDVTTEPVRADGVAAEWVSTPDADDDRVVLYPRQLGMAASAGRESLMRGVRSTFPGLS